MLKEILFILCKCKALAYQLHNRLYTQMLKIGLILHN